MARKRQARKCTGTRSSDGLPCAAWAVNGTNVCASHGGKAPQVRRKATERIAEERLRKIAEKYTPDGAPPVDDPFVALMQVAGEIRAFKDFMGQRVAEMRADSWRYEGATAEQVRAEIVLYERALDRTARVLTDIARLDIEERQMRLADRLDKRRGVVLAGVVQRIADGLLASLVAQLVQQPGADRAVVEAIRAAWPGWLGEIAPREIRAATTHD